MPSSKPRLILTVPDPLMADLRALAAASEKPVATVTLDLLRELQPQIQDLAKLIGHAKAGRTQAAKKALRHMMGNAMAQILAEQLPLKGVK
jgi:hypothetical protein